MHSISRHRFSSLIKKLMAYVKKSEALPTDTLPTEHKGQYPTQPLSHSQDVAEFRETQKQIADLERDRMQRLDQALGTNTHFHETQPYEERLDSEHVMRRAILTRQEIKKEQLHQIAKLLNPDPQQRLARPKILNYDKYFTELSTLIQCPLPEKRPQLLTLGGIELEDDFKYLEANPYLQDDHTDMQLPVNLDITNKFITNEGLYTTAKFWKNQNIVKQIQSEFELRLKGAQKFPQFHEKYAYYTKDTSLGYPAFNLFRVANHAEKFEPNTVENDLMVFS
jgi:hypothetical protein